MITPTRRLEPSFKMIIIIGVLLAFVCAAVYLSNTSFIRSLNNKATDGILANSSQRAGSGAVIIVDIDEKSLTDFGQWPWPRYRLARLLQNTMKLGAKSIGLDMILAEPDRTSIKTLQETIRSEFGYQFDVKDMPNKLVDNDATLAEVLSDGPFVLGIQFLFQERTGDYSSCLLHPLNIVWVQKQSSDSDMERFFRAKSVVCNLEKFSNSVAISGFLNGAPDSDGILRRIPLLIEYDDGFYPNLALATLIQAIENKQIRFVRQENGQSYIFMGDKEIPVDQRGNILINFAPEGNKVDRISAADILNGQVPDDRLRDKIVFIGISASGLHPIYQTPVKPVFSEVEVHAQSAENILTGSLIKRNPRIMYYEAVIGILLASLYCLGLARLGLFWNAVIGGLCILGVWHGSQVIFQSKRILFSPLLPALAVLLNFIVLTIFKY